MQTKPSSQFRILSEKPTRMREANELDWKRGKVKPFVSNIRAKLRPRPMPMNIVQDMDGLPSVVLTEPNGSSVKVVLYGAQVVSWKNEQKEELLFRSSKANWKQPKAIRGGISVCFPQFGNVGSLEQQGISRNRLWTLDMDPSPLPPSDNHSSLDLILKSTREDLKIWPRSFELRLRISLSCGKLVLISRVRNTDNKPFSFTFGLCNYLSVSDIRFVFFFFLIFNIEASIFLISEVCSKFFSEVRIEGLETLDFFDNLMNRTRFTEQADAITFDGQMDRVYLRTPPKIAIIDHEKKKTFVLKKNGMPDAVVWNPWERKAKEEDYKSMICVDSAVIETPVVLKPREEWKGYQELSTVSSSYCSGQLDPRKVVYGFH
ncbi:putative glucose-6-phosphate 1-epimerase isoform X1 [Senna tora]|uniref:glucose-6-phosphate 1-epimerase n=1 Tax=Senna tora TaxID=362788 RepID=A0A834SEJ9_9FABA|nr:putative glucose-6-phosphate 1-epimerase isoform X1 [Senna tora]